jgi:hypothetical protein
MLINAQLAFATLRQMTLKARQIAASQSSVHVVVNPALYTPTGHMLSISWGNQSSEKPVHAIA